MARAKVKAQIELDTDTDQGVVLDVRTFDDDGGHTNLFRVPIEPDHLPQGVDYHDLWIHLARKVVELEERRVKAVDKAIQDM